MVNAGSGGEGRGNYIRSFKRVKRFLEGLGGRPPSEIEVGRIAPDLKTLFDKFCKVRGSCPPSMSIDLSEDLWGLMAQAGIASREIAPLRKAAGS